MPEALAKSSRRSTAWRIVIAALWLATMAGAFGAGAYVYHYRTKIQAWYEGRQGGQVIETEFYSLVVEKLDIPAQGRDGGIDALRDGLLFVNRLGDSWFIDKDHALHELSLKVPVNFDEFAADPYNEHTVKRDQFAVKDILVQHISGGIRLFASYNYWHADLDCYALRVSMLETTEADVISSAAGLNNGWRTVFETTPCRELSQARTGKTRNPTLGAGGRIVAISDSEIMLSVGGFGRETDDEDESIAPPTEKRSYGSTILIDVASGASRNYTFGLRNPQGLAVGTDGAVWLTDHGPRGGDELDLVLDGRNYGHPIVTYGTEYESKIWRRNPRQGHHDGFEKPIYAWVPSIGTSQLMAVRSPLFPYWQGDLLVTSLRAQTLFRVRVEDGRVIFVEPIFLEHRIRDIAETADGAIALKTDDNALLFIRPITAETMGRLDLSPQARGEILATACMGCHATTPDAPDGIGPNLWGVAGRRIASRENYAYSDALRAMKGNWTPEALGAFITDPQAAAPGTAMVLTTSYSPQEVDDLVAFISRLR